MRNAFRKGLGIEAPEQDVNTLGKATELMIQNEERKQQTKRGRKQKAQFDQRAGDCKPSLRSVKGGRA